MIFNNVEEYLNKYGSDLVNLYEAKSNSDISFEVISMGNSYRIRLNLKPYWKWIEEGRKPGKMPPINSIINWIRKKNIPIRNTLKQTAFVIARSIGKKGIKGKFYMKNSKQELPDFKTGLIKALKKDINKSIKNIKTK